MGTGEENLILTLQKANVPGRVSDLAEPSFRLALKSQFTLRISHLESHAYFGALRHRTEARAYGLMQMPFSHNRELPARLSLMRGGHELPSTSFGQARLAVIQVDDKEKILVLEARVRDHNGRLEQAIRSALSLAALSHSPAVTMTFSISKEDQSRTWDTDEQRLMAQRELTDAHLRAEITLRQGAPSAIDWRHGADLHSPTTRWEESPQVDPNTGMPHN